MAASEVTMTIRLHRGDLPDLSHYHVAAVAIDTEAMGLNPHRDRLCVVQLSPGDGSADVVQLTAGETSAPNLTKLLVDAAILKIFHFARFDLGVLQNALGVMPAPLYCTKIASRLARTYSDKHGLKDLVRELLGIDLSKQQQLSDWGAADLTEAQVAYAASDVLHLHALKARLDGMLAREGRQPQRARAAGGDPAHDRARNHCHRRGHDLARSAARARQAPGRRRRPRGVRHQDHHAAAADGWLHQRLPPLCGHRDRRNPGS